MKINIDIGHYGNDSGATHNNLREDKLTHLISMKVMDRLKEYFTVSATTGSLQNRVNQANKNNVDLFVSIHINSTHGATGNELFISRFTSSRTKEIGLNILDEITSYTGLKNRGLRVDYNYLNYDLYVLKNTKMAAVLIECGFIQNDWGNSDIDSLSTKYANGIVKGILKSYNINEVTNKTCPYCGK